VILAKRAVARLDRWQRRSAPIGFLYGVVKKFGDDRGGSLAALLTYYGFLSLLPLLLLLITVLGLVAGGNPSLTHRIESSALAQFPIVGNQLGANIHALHHRSAVGLAVGIVGLVWGSQGAVQSGQFAMAEVWNVPAVDRPGFGARLGRTMATLGTVGAFLLVSTALVGALTTGSPTVPVEAIGAVVSILLNIGLFAMAFRLLTPTTVAWRPLMPGAVVGGFGWTALQYVGGALVEHTLKNSSQVYGFFAIVLGLLAWIYLGAQLTLYAAESNVVRTRRLWPRSLQPPLTDADRRVLTDISMEAKRSEDQGLSMRFESGGGAESRPGSSEVRYHPEGEAGSRSDAESVGNR
jgi:YihY family inner membrane protein